MINGICWRWKHGRRKGEGGALASIGFRNLTFSYQISSNKACFLSFEWVKRNFTTFGSLEKSFWLHPEKSYRPTWKKSSRRLWMKVIVFLSIDYYFFYCVVSCFPCDFARLTNIIPFWVEQTTMFCRFTILFRPQRTSYNITRHNSQLAIFEMDNNVFNSEWHPDQEINQEIKKLILGNFFISRVLHIKSFS